MPPHLLHPRPSHSQTRFCPGVKLAPPIHHVTIIGFERRSDQKIWFLIDVDPQQADPQNNTAGSRNLARKSYTIARRYEDFSHFSQSLQTTFSPARPPLSSIGRNSRQKSAQNQDTLVLPKIKGRIQILPNKQIHIQRRAELERFVDALFQLPTSITQSLLVLEFFGLQKADTEEQLWRDQQSSKLTKPTPKEPKRRLVRSSSVGQVKSVASGLPKSVSQPNLRQPPITPISLATLPVKSATHPLHSLHPLSLPLPLPSRWKRLRCPSIRGPMPVSTTSTTSTSSVASTSSLSLFCTQAATVILPWNNRATPSIVPLSTPAMASSTSTSSSCASIHTSCSTNTCSTVNTSASPSPSHSTNGSPSLRTIKIKVVYDADNIIVIQVPRSIDLKELQQRISQKLADPGMGGIVLDKDPHLLFNHTRSSASSTYQEDISGTDTIIGDQSDWTLAMHTQWHDLDKVTLRCV
ncbi:hypothetical protein PHYBLDRAFT_69471 [Phycomyces blakesleeanus NRRL 1555(-)]|uniref:PX domain-containing protein n=1 Tax=Phycomyces blakesleeanus (strain ATCC 8743b / DSM 1359 / FGSC 10004 / NBRC 33097 / NRRL 1555) TaxID=763407 RepID=A0A167LL64_PHYB8|nr:hypothetical protein PHYBLDRAFT_69471 [Phycomyces blakesleeanus NRRL 1555(-)]OAD70688.1 hypothetical protein PHYBLDRAFT_69471 [Phycomyces blakesleeanus NRRL 1555(-)]|eukprot:XP_018288728.1 hypothetical protein PHYBLDRAFT_69471 [Phycomyces blakesleeanus NRRL 1555(-)]